KIKALKQDLLSVSWASLSFDPARSFQYIRELAIKPPDCLSGLLDLLPKDLRSINSFQLSSFRNVTIEHANKIIDLIHSQKNLYDLELQFTTFSDNIKNILTAFEISSDSLKSLVFFHVDFRSTEISSLWTTLTSLKSIRYLRFHQCRGLEIEYPFQIT